MKGFHENRYYADSFQLSIDVAKNMQFRAHWHTEVEIAYVLEGSILVGNSSQWKELSAGEFMIATSGEIHDYNTRSPESKMIILIFHPSVIGSQINWPDGFCFQSKFVHDEEDCRFKHYLESLIKEANEKTPFYEMRTKGILLCMLGDLLRLFAEKGRNSSKQGVLLIKKSIDFIESNFQRDISLDDAAENVNLDRFYFCRLFRKVTGMNFKDYINLVRVEYCEKAILQRQGSITDIALESGFGSIRTFNRVFREVKGYKPSDLV